MCVFRTGGYNMTAIVYVGPSLRVVSDCGWLASSESYMTVNSVTEYLAQNATLSYRTIRCCTCRFLVVALPNIRQNKISGVFAK